MKNALFLQSWFSHVTDNWYPWLESELKKMGYTTHFPDIAEFRQDAPDLETILNEIKVMNCIDEETIIIGHSLGAVTAMRIAETQIVRQLILVSAWDFDVLFEAQASFWQTKINHDGIKNNVGKRTIIHSDNDPYTTRFHAEAMAKRLEAKCIIIPGGGHLTSKDGITQLPEIITSLE